LHLCVLKKILIIQTAFIGDVVLATALIEKLHRHFPGAQIDFMVRKGNESLLLNHPWLHAVLVWDKKKNKQLNLLKMLRKIRKEQYDQVINVQRFAATGLLTALSGAKERIGFDKNPFSFLFTRKVVHLVSDGQIPLHEVERNMALISHFTDGNQERPRLYPSAADEEKVNVYKQNPYITISPASVWFTKQYPAEKWIDLIQSLSGSLQIFLLGAPSDSQLCESIKQSSGKGNISNLAGKLSFLQSAALMKGAVMNYVNDSAPLHFASAVNAPVTAIYCSTIPAFGFGPLSDVQYIVETREPLDCRPCGLHGYKACPRGHFRCAWGIQNEQVKQDFQN
jgi:lipopolysaccharide heptosyltransferase II